MCSKLNVRIDWLSRTFLNNFSALKFKSSRAIHIVRTRAGEAQSLSGLFLNEARSKWLTNQSETGADAGNTKWPDLGGFKNPARPGYGLR